MLEKSKATLEHPWFQAGEPPVILAVGRLEPQKDFPTLIEAFAKVREARPAKLVILGSGKESSKLKSLVSKLNLDDDVAMPGFVKNPYPYIKQASAYVLSSAWEGLPTVTIEALALGTPVVATDCPSGSAEILDNGKYGTLVGVGDRQAMAKAILKVLSVNSQSVAPDWIQQFDLETATQKYLQVLNLSVKSS
jgi:glycosyltransferase involved in cell wall biosynthesis